MTDEETGKYGEIMEFDETSDVEDTEDGGAIITMDAEGPTEADGEHFDNLAEALDDAVLEDITTTLLQQIKRDKEARSKRDEQYEEGIRRTGLGDDAPGGASFDGASRVVHPMLTEVCVDFSARAMKEIFPVAGPVKDYIPGDATQAKVEKAGRKKRHMNWQLRKQIKEFRSELEQLLTQVPLGGAQYLKMFYDQRLKRPRVEFIAIDDVLIPFAASSFRSAERKTHVQYITKIEYERRVDSGQYSDVDLTAPNAIDKTSSGAASDKIEGRQDDVYNEDGLRTVYETACFLELEEDGDRLLPYIVTIDDSTEQVLSVYRNWEEEDENAEELDYIVEFPFVPWRGAYPIGIVHMIGGISAAATGALRALLDSAHISNSQTALKLKGGANGQNVQANPGEVVEIEGAFNQDDIRKIIMPMPFNQPSPVLYQLLGFLVDSGKGVIQTTFENIADQNTQQPVGTTLAMIEQGMTVFSAIHARLHSAMEQVLEILHRLNRLYLTEQQIMDDLGELIAKRSDYDGPMDVCPVSDPNIFSEAQRQAQVALISQRAIAMPQLYNLRKIEERILEHSKIPNAKELLLPQPEPMHLNAVNENLTVLMGKPIVVFPAQDHLAHIQTHLEFMKHPLFGGSPISAPQVVPQLMTHLRDHLGFWYVTQVFELSSQAAGMDVDKLIDTKDEEAVREMDRLMAIASAQVLQSSDTQPLLTSLPQIIQEAVQFIQQQQPPQPMDPSIVAQQDVQRKTQADQMKAQADQAKSQADQMKMQMDQQNAQMKAQVDQMKMQMDQQKMALDAQKQERDGQREDAKIAATVQREMQAERARVEAAAMQAQLSREKLEADAEISLMKVSADAERQQADIEAKMAMNTADNVTAMSIVAAEIESGDKTALSTGTGINPGSD